jgi:flagellar hook-associated protein 3 FlgL
MIVNKSMFPLQTGFSVISKMQDKFASLQVQLGTGLKSQTLADMGRDLPISLSVRSRLSTIGGYSSNIEQVALRLSFYDNALTRLDKIEGEARNSAVQGQYGTNNINMATIPSLSKARLDEMVTMLNSDIAGRYLFGGNVTDKAPLPTTSELMDGTPGRAGFKTVAMERNMADAGADGRGRLQSDIDPLAPNRVTLTEDGQHPFGFKLSSITDNSDEITVSQPALAAPLGDQIGVTFTGVPAPGEKVELVLALPGGTTTTLTLVAVDPANASGAANEFEIGADADATATKFEEALGAALEHLAESELTAASTFTAAENFFNAAGEPVVRVGGADPYTAETLVVADPTKTVMWYRGQTPAVAAAGMGRLTASANTNTVTLAQNAPYSPDHGFQIVGATASNASAMSATAVGGVPPSTDITIDDVAALSANDTVTLTLEEPDGTRRELKLTAVTGKAGPGQFTIGADEDQTAASLKNAIVRSVTEAAAAAEGNPRQSVSAAVEDSGRVNYGMQANESGYLRLMRSLAAMSVESYPEILNPPSPDAAPSVVAEYEKSLDSAKLRFDAMARRQQLELSESRNAERGSLELVTMELGVARAALGAAEDRHTGYKAQLDNLLSDIETVDKEQVAMELLALQTRLTASYQTTAMVSQLSLVNFL